ncbi:hypothetical protein TorRG33x02_228890 [Trema orientale]|uniref:Uncharacterized protein n=1 Tax=Trema orientale TaxID=63057 RepID=A0A2P5E738_TREOI|nr:hypothetical protein TorRG33x02_228890 [Trema orientale]
MQGILSSFVLDVQISAFIFDPSSTSTSYGPVPPAPTLPTRFVPPTPHPPIVPKPAQEEE